MRRLALAALIAGCGTCLRAQTAPTDAGRIVRDEQNLRRAAPPPAHANIPLKVDETVHVERPSGGPKVRVEAFRFVGNSGISSELLELALIDAKGTDLDLSGLRALADRVTMVYRDEGFLFSRAFLPKQEIKDGVVVIEVVEGRYGVVSATGDRGLGGALRPYLSALSSGELIEESQLEHVLLVMTEVPGLSLAPVFSPGGKPGTSDLNVGTIISDSWQGSVRLDNYGGRYSGAYRLQIDAERPWVFACGDKMSFNAMMTDESLLLGGVRYDVPINGSGLRGYFGYARTDYQLGAGYEGFTGIADTFSAGLSYPLLRSSKTNLSLVFGIENKLLTDRHVGTTYESRDAILASAGIQFDHRDTILGGGLTYGDFKLSAGNVSSDVATSVQGGFGKASVQVARLQNVSNGFTLSGAFSGQVSDTALNAAENFSLGGATSVRSYPNGEAQGTSGAIAQLELRYDATSVSPYLFCDQGKIFAQHGQISRSLGGVGVGVRYRAGSFSAEAACAWKTNGGDAVSDSRQRDPRVWVGMGYRY
jgi:hemolysin activation/secretion protein